jgi:hypothetical protein
MVEYQLLRFVRRQLDTFAAMRLIGPLGDADWLEYERLCAVERRLLDEGA